MEYEVFEREDGKRARVVNSRAPLSTDSYGDGILFLIKNIESTNSLTILNLTSMKMCLRSMEKNTTSIH